MYDPQHGGFGQAPKFPHPSALDLLIERYARAEKQQAEPPSTGHPRTAVATNTVPTNEETLRTMIVTTLEHMANGGVYDQLAGGFHRYSVDERWVVPHFEKMCYDNSELLKNYVHAYQATGSEFFADVARDIIRWMDEWLSDRERGGFYASQDADINMDDDGDYFTWTLDEARAVLTEEEAQVAALRYDINEVGEMHHNPAKNVLYVRASVEEIAARMKLTPERVAGTAGIGEEENVCGAAAMRPTPYRRQDGLCGLEQLVHFGVSGSGEGAGAGPTRGGLLCGRWIACWRRHGSRRREDQKLAAGVARTSRHRCCCMWSLIPIPAAAHREVAGLLEDYAFTALACLDAYEATSDLSYFKFARAITDAMIARFYDATSGGFFDSEPAADGKSLGVLATRRKPLAGFAYAGGQSDGGDCAAADAPLHRRRGLSRSGGADAGNFRRRGGAVRNFCRDLRNRGRASAGESGAGGRDCRATKDDDAATNCYAAAVALVCLQQDHAAAGGKSGGCRKSSAVTGGYDSRPSRIGPGKSFAVLCSGTACQPPISDAGELRKRCKRRCKSRSS